MAREDSYFKKGNQAAKGGKRTGAGGRPPDWLRLVCDQELGDRKIAQLRAKIAAGEPIITTYKGKNGKSQSIVRIPNLKDMQEAADWLADRAQGKAPQTIKQSNTHGIDFVSLIRQAEDERGLDRTV